MEAREMPVNTVKPRAPKANHGGLSRRGLWLRVTAKGTLCLKGRGRGVSE